jgi:WD40 repeat protein
MLFAAGSADKAVAICELSDKAEAVVLRRAQASGPVLSLHFNPVRPELLLATCMNGGHSVINVEAAEQDADDAAAAEAAGNVEQLHSAIDHKKFVVVGRWSTDGRHYATGSHDGSVNVYAAATAAATAGADNAKANSGVVWQRVARFDFTGPVIGDGSNDVYVEALEWLDERNFIVSLREDNYLHVLTLQDNADAAAADAASASASASGVELDAVLSRGLKETHRVNVNETGDDHVSFTILDMKLSPNGLGLLCATDRHRVILLARPHTTPRDADGASSSSATVSRGVHVRNFYSLIVADGYSTPRLAWSPCGRWAYVTSQDRAVVVLEVPSGRSVHRITGHQVNVRDVATHPVTGQLLTCSFDKSCRVWNPIADKQAHAAGDAAASASASS